ncbi:MAG: hypothetical protein KDG52_07710 [Rhodocyclaceae bacterium]|nr:hypothetical protein [Rhodocyclaceae bacterium]
MSRLAALSMVWLAALPPALAQDAPEPTQGFGRLFHSPEQRRLIDHPPPPAAPAEPPVEAGPVRLDGIIRRSDGRTVIWVDGRATRSTEARPAASGNAAILSLPNGEHRRLRVGESIVPGVRE